MAWTADDLISSVRRRGQLPASSLDGKLSDSDILALADEEVLTTISGLVSGADEEYWIKHTDVSLTAGQRDYRIPKRAQGAALREIKLVDSANNFYDVPRVDLEDIDYYRDGANWWWPDGVACAVVGDLVRLAPDPTGTYSLRFYYVRRPSRLVLTSSGQVTTIASVTSQTEVEVDAADHTTGDLVDVIQAEPNFDSLLDSATVTISGTTYTFAASAHSDMAAADYVCDEGVSPVPQIPAELHPLLYRATLVSVLEAIGADPRQTSIAQRKLEQMTQSVSKLLETRVQGAAPAIVRWSGPLRGGQGRYWGGV